MSEETKDELVAEAKALGIKGAHLSGVENLKARIAEAKETKEPEVKAEAKTEKPAKKSEAIFFWKDNQEFSFIVPGDIVDKVQEPGQFYKTTKSVLKLDLVTDAKAIKKLRSHKKFNLAFGELGSLKDVETDMGKSIDKLMALDIKTLANMVGGTVADTRKSKGTLIAEILANK